MKITLTTSEILTLLEGVSSTHLVQDWTLKIREELAAVESDRDEALRLRDSWEKQTKMSWGKQEEMQVDLEIANARIKELQIATEPAGDIWVDPDDEIELSVVKEDRDEWKRRYQELVKRVVRLNQTYEAGHGSALARNVAREAEDWDEA